MRTAAAIVLLHAGALLAHDAAHRSLGIDLALWQEAFAYVVIAAGPLAALALLRARPQAGYALLALTMAGALDFTVYHHYVAVSPDHVAHLPPGEARSLFSWTAAALAALEVAGLLAGWRGWVRAANLPTRTAP
jgi:hypothetical protein